MVDGPTTTRHSREERKEKLERVKLKDKRKAASLSISQDVILHKAESPWEPKRKQDQTDTDEATKVTAVIYFYVCLVLKEKRKIKCMMQRMHIL